MQNADFQTSHLQNATDANRVGECSIPAGCVSKKWLCFALRPYLKGYRSQAVRVFFTAERMERCQIDPQEYPRIRTFSPEATHVIISDLKKFGFLK